MTSNAAASAAKIIYVTRDIERALGQTPGVDYLIITNRTPYSEKIKKEYPDFITLIESSAGGLLGTAELLQAEMTRAIFDAAKEWGNASLLVFKNSVLIENIAHANDWRLLNPPSSLSEKIENKISQIEWLGEDCRKYLPEHSVSPAKNIQWKDKPFILQWAHGHTGDGTLLIQGKKELQALQVKFPDRDARVTAYVRGPSFTINAVVTPQNILAGNISYQITGAAPFTDNAFSTVGNDWGLTHSLLSESEIGPRISSLRAGLGHPEHGRHHDQELSAPTIETMVQQVGQRLRKDGWKGLFGLDFIRDDENGRICLIEINARQPASTTFESILQRENRKHGLKGLTIFETHLSALTDGPASDSLILVNDGAQIIQRVTKKTTGINEDVAGSLELAGYDVISYPNTGYNTDLLRIQSARGIMETHNKFNRRGKEILDALMDSDR